MRTDVSEVMKEVRDYFLMSCCQTVNSNMMVEEEEHWQNWCWRCCSRWREKTKKAIQELRRQFDGGFQPRWSTSSDNCVESRLTNCLAFRSKTDPCYDDERKKWKETSGTINQIKLAQYLVIIWLIFAIWFLRECALCNKSVVKLKTVWTIWIDFCQNVISLLFHLIMILMGTHKITFPKSLMFWLVQFWFLNKLNWEQLVGSTIYTCVYLFEYKHINFKISLTIHVRFLIKTCKRIKAKSCDWLLVKLLLLDFRSAVNCAVVGTDTVLWLLWDWIEHRSESSRSSSFLACSQFIFRFNRANWCFGRSYLWATKCSHTLTVFSLSSPAFCANWLRLQLV